MHECLISGTNLNISMNFVNLLLKTYLHRITVRAMIGLCSKMAEKTDPTGIDLICYCMYYMTKTISSL